MPYFLDLDFYSQTSSAKSSLLTNALLPIPTHLETWRDHCKVPDVSYIFHSLHLSEENVGIHTVENIAHFLIQDVPSQVEVEAFESNDFPNTFEGEEVIPSSYPESDSSSQFYLDPHIIKGSLGEKGNDKESLNTSLETFSRIINKEEYQDLEVPIMCNSFSQALSKLLVNKTLLKRLQVLAADDPLLKPDQTPWTEVKMEEFLMPVVKGEDKRILVEEFHVLKNVKEKLDCQQHCFEKDDIPHVNIGFLNPGGDVTIELLDDPLDLQTILSENFNPPFDFHKTDESSQFDYSGDPILDRNKSPVFGFPAVNLTQRLDHVMDYYNNSTWREKLDPFKKEDFLGQCILVTKREYKKLRLQLWEAERHFDEERLQEPVLLQLELPNMLGRAKDLFTLSPDIDSLPYTKDSLETGFHEQLKCMEDPSKEIALIGLDLDFKLPTSLPPVEKFSKVSLRYKDDCLNEIVHICTAETIPTPKSQTSTEVKEIKNITSENFQQEKHQEKELFTCGDNPLESFMQFRSRSVQEKTAAKVVVKKELEAIEKSNTSDLNSSKKNANENTTACESSVVPKSKITKVSFGDSHEEVLNCLVDFVSPYLDKVKQRGLLPHHQSFYATSVDSIRFLFKEHFQQNQGSQLSTDTSNLNQSLTILLRFRQALHLLIHSCLPSAIQHIASFRQSINENGPIGLLQDRLLKFQHQFQQQNMLHPKLDTLITHFEKEHHDKTTTLIVVQQGLMTLVLALERVLTGRTSFSVQFLKSLEGINTESLHAIDIVIAFETTTNKTSMKLFDSVIQFDASQSTAIKDLCQEMKQPYFGFVSVLGSTSAAGDNTIVALDKPPAKVKLKSPITVIGSVEMMQHRQLVYTLETRHNILFMERNYSSPQLSSPLHHSDIIFGLEVCLVLLPLLEMGTQDWDMELFTKRVIAIGLQTPHCFVLVHGIGAPSKYLLDKIVLQNLYRLRSSLSNLSRSSASFDVKYKVVVAMSQEDVALNINAIAEFSVSLAPNKDDKRGHWLKADMTQDEVFLLQLVCLNSFSAQLLLSKLPLEDILTMSTKQIKDKFPEFSDSVLMYFHHITSKLKSDQMSSSGSSSQVSARSTTSQKSACSSSSNPISEIINIPPSPISLPTLSQPSNIKSPTTVNNPSDTTMRTEQSISLLSDRTAANNFNNGDTCIRNSSSRNLCDDHNLFNRGTRAESREIMESKVSISFSKNSNENGASIGNVSEGNRELLGAEHRKRPSNLSRNEHVLPNKKSYQMLDTADVAMHFMKGQPAVRPPLGNVSQNNIIEIFDDGAIGKNRGLIQRDTTSQVENMNLTNVIEICDDPEIEHIPTNDLRTTSPHLRNVHTDNANKMASFERRDTFSSSNYKQNEVNNCFPISKLQEKNIAQEKFNAQQIRNEENDSQELFFLGKSQNSPHRPVDDDDGESSIILVKSQDCSSFRRTIDTDPRWERHLDLPDHNTTNSVLSDSHEDTNNLIVPDSYQSSSNLPIHYQHPFSLPVVKPNSNSISAPMNQSNLLSNKPYQSSVNSTPSEVKYGIFSAKVRRRVKPMPIPETLPKSFPSLEDNLTPGTSGVLQYNTNPSIHLGKSLRPDDTLEHQYNMMMTNSKPRSSPIKLPELTQLPFSVSWDLRKHIKETNSGVLGKSNNHLNRVTDSFVSGERISRVPYVLRNRHELGEKEINPNHPIQSLSDHRGSSLDNIDIFRSIFPSHTNNASCEADRNNSLSLPSYDTSHMEERGSHNIPRSDLSTHELYSKTNSYSCPVNLISSSPRTDKENKHNNLKMDSNLVNQCGSGSFHRQAEGIKDNQAKPHCISPNGNNIESSKSAITHLNDYRHFKRNSYFPYNVEGVTKQKQANPYNPQHRIDRADIDGNQRMYSNSHSDILKRGEHIDSQHMQDKIYQGSSVQMDEYSDRYSRFPGELQSVTAVQGNRRVNPSSSIGIPAVNKDQRINAQSRIAEQVNRDYNSRFSGFQRVSNNEPLQEIYSHGNNDITNSNRNIRNDGIPRNIMNHPETNTQPDKPDKKYERFLASSIISSSKENHNLRETTDRYRPVNTASYPNTPEEMNRYQEKRGNESGYVSRSQERLPPHGYVSRSQERLRPQLPPTNIKREYNLPYTPRRNISIGLAQPLQRTGSGNQEKHGHHTTATHHTRPGASTSSAHSSVRQNHTSTHQHPPSSPRAPPSSVTEPTTRSTSSPSSPPMDLMDNQHSSQHYNNLVSDIRSANKMRKWNSHLQRHAEQRFEYASDTRQDQRSSSLKRDSPPRQKRLCMEKTDDNKGQMVLVFK